MSEGARSKRFKFSSILKVLFALALLAWVANGLDWRDKLELWAVPQVASLRTLEAPGSLEGNWREEALAFRFSKEQTLGPEWPETAIAAQAADTPLAIERRTEGGPGYDWRPGMPRVFLDLQGHGLAFAMASLIAGLLCGVTRWWRILALAGCPTSWWTTLRLAFLGVFFNLVMPGLTGGDLPKAVLAVREHPDRRADALATVVIDRMVGLWALVLVATGIIWSIGGGFQPLKIPSLAVSIGVTVGMFFVLSPGPRRALGIDRLLEKLPQGQRLKKLEESATLFQNKPFELILALLLSSGNHFAVIAAVYAIGDAFGASLEFSAYVGIVPVANLISAIPISPSGWGVGEAAFKQLFLMMGSTAALGVAVSLTYRLCNLFLGLLGGLSLLFPGGAEVRREARKISESSESGG